MLRQQQVAVASLVGRRLRRPMRSKVQSFRRLPLASTPGAPRSKLLLRAFSSGRSASGSKPGSSPSFEVAAAFEGHDELDDDEHEGTSEKSRRPQPRRRAHDDQEEDEAAQKAAALSEQFRVGMEKKKRWMHALAESGDFAAVAKSVADCYAPLYAEFGAAIGAPECPLIAVYTEVAGAGATPVETKFQPQRFDDTLAKLTEQEALSLLVVAQQAPLAIAIVEHRLKLEQQFAAAAGSSPSSLTIQGDSVMDDRALELSAPFRSFFSWAVGAYSFVQDYDKVLDTYERALAAEVYPTANMNATFLGALVALDRFDDAFAFYERVATDSRPVSVFFYRQLLFAVSVAQNTALAQRVVDDMKRKGFKMRAEDYLNAIRTFDSKYFVTPRTVRRGNEPEREQLAPPMDRYTTCIERTQERDENPDAFHELDEASRSVLALFDETVELASITPRHAALFPRAITAAVFLEEFEKALEIVNLHDEVADKKTPLHFTGVRMAVNAYLMLNRPAEAWEFVKRTYLDAESRQCAPHFANIMDYLCIHDRVSDVLELLEDARALEMQDLLLSNTVAKTVIPTLCRNVASIEDNAVWNALVGPKSGFGVLTSPYWCEFFVDHCSRNDRMGLVVRALDKRSKKKVPVIKPRLALHLMTRFEERGELENVTKVFSAMDKERAKGSKGRNDMHERVLELVGRVYETLGMHDAGRRLRRKHTQSETATDKA